MWSRNKPRFEHVTGNCVPTFIRGQGRNVLRCEASAHDCVQVEARRVARLTFAGRRLKRLVLGRWGVRVIQSLCIALFVVYLGTLAGPLQGEKQRCERLLRKNDDLPLWRELLRSTQSVILSLRSPQRGGQVWSLRYCSLLGDFSCDLCLSPTHALHIRSPYESLALSLL